MDEQTKKEIKDLLVQALISGRANSSQLASDILKKMDSSVHSAIEMYVNEDSTDIKNSIISIQTHLKGQDSVLSDIVTEQGRTRKELEKLQTDTGPFVDGTKVITGAGKFILWICGIIIAIAAVIKILR